MVFLVVRCLGGVLDQKVETFEISTSKLFKEERNSSYKCRFFFVEKFEFEFRSLALILMTRYFEKITLNLNNSVFFLLLVSFSFYVFLLFNKKNLKLEFFSLFCILFEIITQ